MGACDFRVGHGDSHCWEMSRCRGGSRACPAICPLGHILARESRWGDEIKPLRGSTTHTCPFCKKCPLQGEGCRSPEFRWNERAGPGVGEGITSPCCHRPPPPAFHPAGHPLNRYSETEATSFLSQAP